MLATTTAYQYGGEWLTQLKQVLEQNVQYVKRELTEKTKIKVMLPEATYLIWLDFSAYQLGDEALKSKLSQKAKVILNEGKSFGTEGENHARFNAAAPFSIIEEATQRLVKAFES